LTEHGRPVGRFRSRVAACRFPPESTSLNETRLRAAGAGQTRAGTR
jgi:hypothetical protein